MSSPYLKLSFQLVETPDSDRSIQGFVSQSSLCKAEQNAQA